jgi:hypothetical protein
MAYASGGELLSDSELLRYSKQHLKYEIEMFFHVGIKLSRTDPSKDDPESVIDKNVLVESFAIHLRNLLLFLYPYGHDERDVISDYFFIDRTTDWKQKRPKETESLRNLRTRASQEISHLTVLRRDGTDDPQGWPILKIMDEIKPILEIFVNNASSQKLDGSVKDALAAIHAKMTSSVTFQIPTDVSSKSPFVNVIAAPSSTNEILYTSSSLPESIIPKLPRR